MNHISNSSNPSSWKEVSRHFTIENRKSQGYSTWGAIGFVLLPGITFLLPATKGADTNFEVTAVDVKIVGTIVTIRITDIIKIVCCRWIQRCR
jgi:hypothetical protein